MRQVAALFGRWSPEPQCPTDSTRTTSLQPLHAQNAGPCSPSAPPSQAAHSSSAGVVAERNEGGSVSHAHQQGRSSPSSSPSATPEAVGVHLSSIRSAEFASALDELHANLQAGVQSLFKAEELLQSTEQHRMHGK